MYLDDMTLDMTITTKPVKIDKTKMINFAIEYDPIPIHYDEEYSSKTRFGKPIAPGVMSFMAVWAEVVKCNLFGNELIAGKSTKIEWMKPVFAEDILIGKGKITKIERRNPYNGIAELTLKVYNQNNELVLTNVTESIISYRNKQL